MKQKIILVALAGFLVIAIAIASTYAYRYYMAPTVGKVQAEQQIESGPYRIAAYNYFFDLYGAIKSYEVALKALDDNMNGVNSDAERERILATIAGLKAQRARAINQYNMDAQKDYTIGQFRDWSLPYQIPIEER